jgi:dihydrolipoamide dehydrogenase
MAEKFDVIIIGGGPGGYVAAIRAAQLGLKTACVEKRGTLGGTCLNVGCIPSKALLESSHLYAEAAHDFEKHGIKTGKLEFDLSAMLARKNGVIKQFTGGIEMLFKKNKVTYIKGAGKIVAAGKVDVDGTSYEATNIVIATGSEVVNLPGVTLDEKIIVSSTGALELAAVPNKMVIIGAGVIGLELGSVYKRLGANVTVVEYLDRITPGMDLQLSKDFQKVLEKQGFTFKLSTKVVGVEKTGKAAKVTVEPAAGGTKEVLDADVVLVAIGRKPYTAGLGLQEVGVALDERGRIKTDSHFQTNIKGIYAIGDVIVGPMLAHKAEDEGVAVAEILGGQKPHVNYDVIPGIIYTAPEVATVGKTEEELKAAGIEYNVGKFPMMANSRAVANGNAEGYVKILADKKTDRVLGCHIIGPDAGTLIAEVAIAMEFKASAEDVARTCHAHPTLNEAVKEAALAVDKRAIHA